QVLQAGRGPGRGQDPDEVDAEGGRPAPVLGQPGPRQPAQPSGLGVVDRLHRAAETGRASGLDLAEDELAPVVPGHQVELAVPAPPVAVHHLPAEPLEVDAGQLLTVVPDLPGLAPRHTPTGHAPLLASTGPVARGAVPSSQRDGPAGGPAVGPALWT